MGKSKKHTLEEAVAHSVRTLDPASLIARICSSAFDASHAPRLARMLLRSPLILTHPDAVRQSRRDACLDEIVLTIQRKLGDQPARDFRSRLSVIAKIEAGYAVLSRSLDASLGNGDPAQWLWASLRLAADGTDWAQKEIDLQVERGAAIDGSTFTLPGNEGEDRYAADELIAMIDTTTSTILRMYAARWNWVGEKGAIVVPEPPNAASYSELDAVAVQTLAQAFYAWRRIDDNIRFFGGDIVEEHDDRVAQTVWRHAPSQEGLKWQRTSLLAHEALTGEIALIFHQLVYREDAHLSAASIAGHCPLYPGAYVCAGELQAVQALDIILSTSIAADQSLYGGLRLTEWVRGYAVLIAISEAAANGEGDASRLLIVRSEAELVSLLGRLGLRRERAQTFLDRVTFSSRSRDFVDEPLIRLADGRLLLFGPTICHGEIARILLSKLAHDGISLDRRGKRFEAEMQQHCRDWMSPYAKGWKATRGGEEFEFDLLVPWDGHIFLFECKSRAAPGMGPAHLWQSKRAWRNALHQTKRLAEALVTYPDILDEALGEDARRLKLVPCVVSALPFQIAGAIDGVYFTDFSAIATFFEFGETGIYQTRRFPGGPPVRESICSRRLWSGPAPNAIDLLYCLDTAPTLDILDAHIEETVHGVKIGEDIRIETTEITRVPDDTSRAIEALKRDGWQARHRKAACHEGLMNID